MILDKEVRKKGKQKMGYKERDWNGSSRNGTEDG